jgi:hypothetical protein
VTQVYNLGQIQNGYSYIWFNAGTSRRYTSIFTANGVPSNAVTVDVLHASGYLTNQANNPQAYPIKASSVCYIPGATSTLAPGARGYSTVTGPQGTAVGSPSSSGTYSSVISY